MRGASRRADSALAISVRSFAWEPELIATIRHSTLPWLESFAETLELPARPLADLKELGTRDRSSLVGQFAAHQALLQFAGIADGDFSIGEWAVSSRRGSDCRLIRIAARPCNAIDAPPVLTAIEQFAEAVRAPRLETFRHSWARAETVYSEVLAALTRDVAADLRWLRCSARGEFLPPGTEVLRETAAGATSSVEGDMRIADSLRAMSVLDGRLQVIAIGGGSILERYSSLGDVQRLVPDLQLLAESEIIERLVPIAAATRIVMIVPDGEPLDRGSERVVHLASTLDGITIVRATRGTSERSWFVVSTRLAAREALVERLRSCRDAGRWLDEFVASPAFMDYLRNGELPPSDAVAIDLPEPRRSYVAALALLGQRIPIAIAKSYLEQFFFAGELRELTVEGLAELTEDEYRFLSPDAVSRVMTLIPAASHASLYRIAARAAGDRGCPRQAARLLLEAGDAVAAVEMLTRIVWTSADEIVRELAVIPIAALSSSPALARRFADALIDCGRYRDAKEVAHHLPDRERELTIARSERQTGDYDAALQRLEKLAGVCEADLLRAEILSVHRRSAEARELLRSSTSASEDDRVRIAYQLALLEDATDPPWQSSQSPLRDYYAARLDTYRAAAKGDAGGALAAVERSLASARTVIQKIDALLDRMYVLFSAGRWPAARAAALDGLSVTEETQGDRAAGGFLFVIAYLAADDGQWAHASQRIERLRRFYSGTRDDRHLDELALLSAHLDFSRGQFDAAARQAESLLDGRNDAQIREAAALIVDESNWILGREIALHSTGSTENVELTERHRLLRSRRGGSAQTFSNPFHAALAQWERGGALPAPRNGTERLLLFRSALGRGDRAAAELVGGELGIEVPKSRDIMSRDAEQAVIRAIAAGEFPFDERPLAGVMWRYATRNRLRQWQQIGPLPSIEHEKIDAAAEREDSDWIVFSDRELLLIEGISTWSADARNAVVALFRTKAEVSRLRRILEQEESDRPPAERHAASGIIGESTAVRDVLALIGRVARRDVPICILGESGTGKELVARAIHAQSARRARPFTALNCAALPETLIESELFGHVRGAFTGADRDRPGVIESADGGTLFLDEIGEMPLTAQAKLLRFLQDGEFRRVGDTANRSADVRIVAATNRKLESAVEEGRFREDLYYRIRGLEALLPPLRERGRDIILLAAHFIIEEREKHRTGPTRLSSEAEAIFLAYHWPGNVRELQNTIRAAHAIAGETREIDVDHLPERLRRIIAPRTTVSSYQDAVTRFRRDLIERSLVEAMGNQNRAASRLNISRQALAYQIRELGIMVNKPRKAKSIELGR